MMVRGSERYKQKEDSWRAKKEKQLAGPKEDTRGAC
jgi:hypothetical protein